LGEGLLFRNQTGRFVIHFWVWNHDRATFPMMLMR
jgi:hypothetical protein